MSSTIRRAAATVLLVPVVAFPQALPDAKELMAKHNAALGPRATLEGHTTLHMAGTLSIAAMGMEATLDVYRAKPNKVVQKLVLGAMGEMKQGFDGKVAWVLPPAGMDPQVLEGDMADEAKRQADFFANFQDPANYTKAETVELADFEGRKCYKVSVMRGEKPGFEYFDQATGLIAGIQASQASAMGTVESLTIFNEYQDFGGLKFPTRIETRAGPQNIVMSIKTVEFDKVEPAMFDLPEAVKAKIKP